MPDKWEYPWFAAWDLAFHCVALAHVDPAFAKYQLILLCREWFQHPNGALPAYEWDFGDVNPPVQAWAALEVFAIDGGRDIDFPQPGVRQALVNFTWWVNLEDKDGDNVFEGGFLGLDNIGPIDRSHLPVGGVLEQSDATGWMAAYALAMVAIAGVLNRSGQRPAVDLILKFPEHFASIRRAMETQGLWDDADGLFYDRLVTSDGTVTAVKVRSMVGVIPVLAAGVLDEGLLEQILAIAKGSPAAASRGLTDPDKTARTGLLQGAPGDRGCCSAWLTRTGWSACCPRSSTKVSSCRRTGCGRLGPPPGEPLRAGRRGAAGQHRLRASRIDHQHVRRKLQLAGTSVVPTQLPGDRCPGALRPLLRRQLPDLLPDGVGPAADARRDRPGPAPAHDLASSWSAPTAGGPALVGPNGFSRTPAGRITCCSTSTSTVIMAPGWGPPTRLDGPEWWPTPSAGSTVPWSPSATTSSATSASGFPAHRRAPRPAPRRPPPPGPRRPPPPGPRPPARPPVVASDLARRRDASRVSAPATVATGGHLDLGPRSVIVCRAPRS